MAINPVPVGRPSFLNAPRSGDLATLQADFAVIGVPYAYSYTMEAVTSPSGSAPAAIREQSCHFVQGDLTLDHYDFDMGGPLFAGKQVRIVDCGDVAMTPGQFEENSRGATEVIGEILDRGAIPIVLGGDHAIPIPVMRAYEGRAPMVVVQIDAHIDWREERYGVREGLSSPMRRASELRCVTGMAQIGMRGVGSARQAEVDDALAYGSVIVPAEEVQRLGVEAALAAIPAAERYYITFDADGLDAAIAPAVLDPGFGGLTFREASDLLRGVARKGKIVGYDIVEVVPSLDPHGLTSRCVARLTMNLMGEIVRQPWFGDRA
jgi:agmatinase